MKQIRSQIEKTTSDYDREKLQERLAKLVGGVAVIKVGAATETEMKEKKARVEDALHATRAAVEEGIVPGGGVALLRCIEALDKLKLDGDEKIGVNIVRRALEEPLRQIVEQRRRRGRDGGGQGPRVQGPELRLQRPDRRSTKTWSRPASSIPTKVARTALQNAGSIASLMLTTEALVADIPEEKKSPSMPGGHGGMGDMY